MILAFQKHIKIQLVFIALGLAFFLPSLAEAQTQVSFAWQANNEPDLAGYRLFHRTEGNSYNYSNPAWQGSNTTCSINISNEELRHYFVLRAFDTEGLESINSDEACFGCSGPDEDPPPEINDNCPNDPNKTEPGICGCGVPDIDSDSDGTLNCNDQCPGDPGKVYPGTCGCDIPDIDTDGDGTLDCNDNCPYDPEKINPGVNGCGFSEPGNDPPPANNDNCPNDPNKTEPGVCGCGIPDIDTDRDGTLNCNDQCPNDPNKTKPGVNGCGVPESSNDSPPANNDNCPNDPNKTESGVCGCGIPDNDTDGDGTLDCNDRCPNNPNKIRPGVNGCGVPEAGNDPPPANSDNCPNDPNKTESGVCGCGIPDIDTDRDGTLDCNDSCPNDADKVYPGTCSCGSPDIDSDGDGTLNCNDSCPDDSEKTEPGICGCGTEDIDTDKDGVSNCDDKDDDNDGISDKAEKKAPNQGDANQDGIPDKLQCNVGSIKTNDQDNYISMEAPEGTCISSFNRVDTLPSEEFPQDTDFIYGLYEYVVQDIGYGKSIVVTIILPQGAFPDTFYVYGQSSKDPTDHWYEFLDNGQTGAELEENSITVFLTDAKKGDNVLTRDGKIESLWAPGYPTGTERAYNPDKDSTTDSGSTGCFIDCLP